MTLYLLHFDEPISPDHTTQHYLGFTTNLRQRLEAHAAGGGARLLAVARERGIGWTLARTWPDATRGDERYLKNRHYGTRLCPICTPRSRRALSLPSGWRRKRLCRPRTRFVVATRRQP